MNRSIIFTIGAGFLFFLTASPAAEQGNAKAPTSGRIIDLSPHYTTRFDAPGYEEGGKQLPTISPIFDGLPFDLRGQLTLWGRTLPVRREYQYPTAVRGIRIDARFDELHLCHHARWSDVVGRAIGFVRLHYAGGTEHVFPIEFGRHLRDWFFLPSYEDESVSDPETKVIWRDPEEDDNDQRGFRRLWKSRFINPHPERRVATIDFESARGFAHYSVIAATIAARDESRDTTPSIPFDQPRREFTGTMEITVLDDATGKPLPDAVIDPFTLTRGVSVVAEKLATDEHGKATLRYWREETRRVFVRLRAEGYELTTRAWDDVIPESTEFRLRRGKSIGGILLDETDEPVSDATVRLGSLVTLSDQAGRWQLTGLGPYRLYHHLEIGHPDFATLRLQLDGDVKWDALEGANTVLRFRGGQSLSGVVKDGADRPVAGARVIVGFSLYDAATRETLTDALGRFRIGRLRSGPSYVTASAPDMSPVHSLVEIGPEVERLTLRLQPSNVVQGRVVDEAGRPLEGVRITTSREDIPRTIKFNFVTQADGRFRWGEAPAEPMTFSFSRKGSKSHRRTINPEDRNDVIVTMKTIRSVRGRVVDAETKHPLPRFKISIGRVGLGDQLYSRQQSDGFNGRFAAAINWSGNAIVLIEAPGYVPKFSAAFSADAPPALPRFEMLRGEERTGVVLLPDGKPAAGAVLAVKGRGTRLELDAGVLNAHSFRRSPPIIAQPDGTFRLPLQAEPKLIVAAHREGYAEVDYTNFTTGGEIRLRPWGRMAAKLTYDGEPIVNASVMLYPADRQVATVSLKVPGDLTSPGFPWRTDASGQVAIDRLPPGDFQLAAIRLLETKPAVGQWRPGSQTVPVHVESGKTTSVRMEVLQQYRTVFGRITVPAGMKRTDQTVKIDLFGYFPVKPEGRSVPGKPTRDAALAKQGFITPHFQLQPDSDGSFSIEDVPSGRYRLRALLYSSRDAGSGGPKRMGDAWIPVVVPGVAQTNPEPVDIGEHEIVVR